MTTRKPSKNALSEIIAQAGSWAVSPPSPPPSSETASSTDAMGATSGLLRVGAYCRYSSHAQDDGFSLPAQHDAIEREARVQGTWALRWYDEPATSAYTEDLSRRPIFLQMLQDAADGKLDVVVVHRLDRFSRKMSITSRIIPALLEAGVQFVSVQERFDATTPIGRLSMHVVGMFAEHESAHKGMQIRNGWVQRAKRGLHASRIPFGYRWNGTKQCAEPDTPPSVDASDPEALDGLDERGAYEEDRSDHAYAWNGLQMLFRLVLAGEPDYRVAAHLNEMGYRLTTPTRAKTADGKTDRERLFNAASVSVIRRSVYYRPFTPDDQHGTVRHREQEFRGLHLAALGWDQWQQMQDMARNRLRGWYGVSNRLGGKGLGLPYTAEFRGAAVCAECGGRLYVWRTVHNKDDAATRRVYERYVCTARDRNVACSQDRKWARVEDVRALWQEWVREHLAVPANWQDMISAMVNTLTDEGRAQESRRRAQLHRERLRWVEKRERAIDLYADGFRDKPWMQTQTAEADAAIRTLDRSLRAKPQAARQVRQLDAGQVQVRLEDIWAHATTEERIILVSHIIRPLGLRLHLYGAQGQVNRWHPVGAGDAPISCAIASVELQPAFERLCS